jgi:hypothetical protein
MQPQFPPPPSSSSSSSSTHPLPDQQQQQMMMMLPHQFHRVDEYFDVSSFIFIIKLLKYLYFNSRSSRRADMEANISFLLSFLLCPITATTAS